MWSYLANHVRAEDIARAIDLLTSIENSEEFIRRVPLPFQGDVMVQTDFTFEISDKALSLLGSLRTSVPASDPRSPSSDDA